MLAFAKAFLTYLTKIKLDTRYHAFEVFLERSKTLKERKNVTSRIIIKETLETSSRTLKSQNVTDI